MVNKKISELDPAATITGTEVVPLYQAGATKAATVTQLLALIVAGAPGNLDTFFETAAQMGLDEATITTLQTLVAGKADAATVAATYSTKRIAALEGINAYCFGDSYSNNNAGAAGPTLGAFPYRVTGRHRTATFTNYGAGGTRSDQIAAAVRTNWVPNSRGLVILSDIVINDERQYLDTTGTGTTTEAFRSMLAHLSAAAIEPYTATAFQFGPSWTTGTSSTVGAYFDFAWTGTTDYLLVNFVTGTGGTLLIKDTTGTTVATVATGGYKQNFVGAVKLAGYSTSSHTLRGSVSSGTVTIVGHAPQSATPPLIVWFQPGGFPSTTETTRLQAYIAACATITGDWGNLLPVACDASYNPATMTTADQVHLNDLGNAYAADLIQGALKAQGYSAGLNILSTLTTYSTQAPSYTAPGATAPAAATAVTATAGNQAILSWTLAADGGATITGQTIQASTDSGGTWTTVTTVGPAVTSYTILTGLTGGTSYTFRILTTNSVGSTPSAASTAVTAGATITVYAADSFTRADSTTVLGSTPTGGYAWTFANACVWGILSNQARMYVAPSTPFVTDGDGYIDDGQANGTITAVLPAAANNVGVLFRAAGSNNATGFVLMVAGGVYVLKQRTANTAYTTLNTTTTTAAAGDTITVILNGSSIVVKVNGTQIISTTNAAGTTGTRHGMWSNNIGSLFDTFSHNSATN